jgi:CDP-paratose 2-epimerase
MVSSLAGRELRLEHSEVARRGDHVWWISDVRRFRGHFPGWRPRFDLPAMLREMVEAARERFGTRTP